MYSVLKFLEYTEKRPLDKRRKMFYGIHDELRICKLYHCLHWQHADTNEIKRHVYCNSLSSDFGHLITDLKRRTVKQIEITHN